jgi:hypothetical protein
MLHESIKWMCPVQNFLPSKQHAQKFLSCQLFAYKEPVNCSAQLFGFAQKILGTKHPPIFFIVNKIVVTSTFSTITHALHFFDLKKPNITPNHAANNPWRQTNTNALYFYTEEAN